MESEVLPVLRTDKYAKIFLYNTHETVACVPRHVIQMSERVKPDLLQEAVSQTLLRFPHMMLGIEPRGNQFTYYRNVRPVPVLPFDGVQKRYTIGSKDTNGHLFLVGYEKDRIILEYQHSISDGRGFEEFIKCVLLTYLKLCGKPVQNDGTVRSMDTYYTPAESADGYGLMQDREYSPNGIWQKTPSLHAPALCDLPETAPEIVNEITFPFSQLHSIAKEYHVSPLSILAPLLARAYEAKFQDGSGSIPIAEIPVDLRPIVPTATTRYFICFIDLPYLPEQHNLPFPELFQQTKEFLKTQMEPEQLLYRAKSAADRCHLLHTAQTLSLEEKQVRAQQSTRDFVKEDSYLITNVGQFKLPECCLPYVLDYGAILPCATQPFAMLVSSYHGKMKLALAQRDHDLQVCNDFVKQLREIGVDAQVNSYPFACTRYNGMECI